MKIQPLVSLCISTYNWPEALELCLLSILEQTCMPAEIIIGDDGSTVETTAVINRMQQKFPVPVIHVWQPDEGFRLAQIRNKSFAAASGKYIIQIDGDVVLNRHFVEDHLRFKKKNVFIAGSRSLVPPQATLKLLQSKLIGSIAGIKLEKNHNARRFLPASFVVFQLQKGISQAKYTLGVNMAFWKEDLLKVNGYNEDYTGWGKEDNDLSIRLCNAGVSLHFLKFAAIIYHLHHNGAERNSLSNNELMMMQALKQKTTYVPNGLNKYL